MKPASLSYARPATLSDAVNNLQSLTDQCRVIAGGQSLGPMLNLRLAQPKHLVDISQLTDLRGAKIEDGFLAIGACVTHAEIEDGKIPDVTLGLMPFVARGIAYRAVRNRGTIGGSLAHADPAADWLTTTIAMDASLRLVGPAGLREIKVADFVTGAMETAIEDGEVIVAGSGSPLFAKGDMGSRQVRQEAWRFCSIHERCGGGSRAEGCPSSAGQTLGAAFIVARGVGASGIQGI